MHRLSTATFDRFIRGLVVTAILLTTIPTTDARSAAASPLTPKASQPAPQNFVPPLPIVRHNVSIAPKQSKLIYLPIRYKTWQAAPLSQSSRAILPQPSVAQTTPGQADRLMAATGPMFIENVGQFDSQVQFLVRGSQGNLFLTGEALWLSLVDQVQAPLTSTSSVDVAQTPGQEQVHKGVNLKLSFIGANPQPHLEPFNRLDTHVSYFIGNDPAQWRTDVPVWGGVRYVDLYPGIDLEVTREHDQIQQRLVVRDESQLANVRLHIDGANSVELDNAARHSQLRLATTMGEFAMPLFEVVGVSANASVPGPTIANADIIAPFALPTGRGPGLHSLPYSGLSSSLAITNTSDLLYSTFLGGGGADTGYGIAVDASGAAYVVGTTSSTNFTTTTGAFSTTLSGMSDVFVTKIAPDGSHLIYSTYLGGSGYDEGRGIAIDTDGAAYVTGYTTATFPITNAAATMSLFRGGAGDAFVAKLTANGTALAYSAYLGGGSDDQGYGIAVDPGGAAYVVGKTGSTNFLTVTGSFSTALAGLTDAFVTKLTVSGVLTPSYSTYLGGGGLDEGYDIALDQDGNAHVTGDTKSTNFPTTTVSSLHGTVDAFVAKLNANGSELRYAIYLGGGVEDYGRGITVDRTGAAYIAGYTVNSTCGFDCLGVQGLSSFPTTPGAYQSSSVDGDDAFVIKLRPDGSEFVYSSLLGGASVDESYDITVDANGYATIVGKTQSADYPTTTIAIQSGLLGGQDGFVAQFNATGSNLTYSTYLGGDSSDQGQGIAVRPGGTVYVTGDTQSTTNFPIYAALQSGNAGGQDAFVTQLAIPSLLDKMARGCACPLCCPYSSRNHVGGPIDTLSGNYTYQKSDAAISVLGGTLEFKRSYSADTRDLFTRTLGSGWTHNQDIRLVFPTDPGGVSGQVQLQAPGGSQLPFFDQGNGGYQAYPGVTASMSRITATGGITTYVVTATNQTVYTFNSAGLVTQTVNPAGNVITYTYYPTGSLQSVQSYGRSLRFYYDAQNRLQRVLDPIDRATQFGYNANGDLAVVTDTRLLTWTYQYSGTTHLLTRILDPDQRTVERTEYDDLGRASKQYNGQDELVVQLQFGAGGIITVTDGQTRTSVDRYGRGTWLGGTDSATQAITRTYDANFKPSFFADPNGNGPQMRWSANGGNLERVTDARGYTTTMAYDSLNNLKQITDTRGVTTSYTYSGTILTRTVDALGNSTIYTYGQNSLLTAQQDALGRITQFENGTFGERKAITVTDASGAIYSVTRYQYDPVGRLITTTDPIGRITINSYNDGDQLIAVTNNYTTASTAPKYLDTWNLITRYGYDGFGRQIAVTDTLNQVTRNWYDAAGRLISVTANFSPTVGQNYSTTYNLITRYGYDTVGNRIWVTDTLSQATRTEYDNLNRPVTVTTNYKGSGAFIPSNSDENVIRITHYDPAGNVIEQIGPPNASGEQRVTRTWYDALNRVYSTTVNFTTTLSADPNTYNLTTWYEYDPAGNQTAITDTAKHVTHNYYDRVGRLISTTVNYSPTLGVNAQNQFNLTTRYEYDAVGNRVAITDPVTLTTRYAFDALNRLVVMTQNVTITNGLDPNLYNLVTRYQYDAIGNRVAVTDALTHTMVYTYNAVGQLIAEGNSVIGNVTRYQYDALGRTVVVTDPLTHLARTYYDAAGRVVSTTNALTGTTVITYDALGRRVGVINENGKSSYMGYDGLGRTIAVTDAAGSVTYFGYDALGNRMVVTDALTHPTTYTYDVGGRLIVQADALGNKTRTVYDGLGNRLVVTDANGIATGYGYDALNRLSIVTESLTTTLGLDATRYNITTTYAYDPIGNRTVMTNGRGYTTTYGYDALSRLISMRDPLTNTTRYRYDAVGNRVAMTDALTQTTHYRYDELNRVTSITYTTGMSNVVYAYDKAGNRTFMTDSLGTMRYVYDELNRLKTATDPYNQVLTYTYDPVGNRTNLAYPDGKVVTYGFDAANRLSTLQDWDGQDTRYRFDKAGRLITTTLPNGVAEINTYDDANRLTHLKHLRISDGQILGDYQFVLDGMGNRKTVTETLRQPTTQSTVRDTTVFTVAQSADDAYVSTTTTGYINTTGGGTYMGHPSRALFTYHAGYRFNPVVLPANATLVDAEFYLKSYTNDKSAAYFDVYGEASTNPAAYSTYANFMGRSLTVDSIPWTPGEWTQNEDYNLQVTDLVQSVMTNYWQNGNPIALRVYGGGSGTRQAWSTDGDPTKTARLTLTYDHVVTDSPSVTASIQYTYDPLYRLTSANYSGSYTYTFAYGYDKVGNRTVQTRTITNTQVTNYTYDAANRLSNAGGVNYTWDNNGNLTNDGSSLYRYDQANRLISTTLSGATTLYNHNGDGVRLRQVSAGMPTTYTQDLAAPLPVVLQSKTGATTSKHLYSIGTRPIGQYTSAWEYLLPDALGSVRQIADASGNVTLAKSYEPYGSVLNNTGTASSIFGYAGEQIDTTGLVYLRARYMQPTLGMFLTEDTASGIASLPLSMHLYLYAWANPINRVDPSGLQQPPPKCDFGDICSTGPTGPYVPPTPPLQPTAYDPLTPGQWRLSQQEAYRFGIPPALVAATIATEIVDDTDLVNTAYDEFTRAIGGIADLAYSTRDRPLFDLCSAILECFHEYCGFAPELEKRGIGYGFAPGIAHMHAGVAVRVEQYYATNHPSSNLLPDLGQSNQAGTRLRTLLSDEGSIRYAAAYLRQYADYRKGAGNQWRAFELSDIDMVIIYTGYRCGVEGCYGSLENFQMAQTPVAPDGRQRALDVFSGYLQWYKTRQ